jgi:hypothetical protein
MSSDQSVFFAFPNQQVHTSVSVPNLSASVNTNRPVSNSGCFLFVAINTFTRAKEDRVYAIILAQPFLVGSTYNSVLLFILGRGRGRGRGRRVAFRSSLPQETALIPSSLGFSLARQNMKVIVLLVKKL